MTKENHFAGEREETVDAEDLSQEIAQAVPRKPKEQVTCRRVNKQHYRCNWWTLQETHDHNNPTMTGLLMVTTSRICHSQFLHVTKSGQDLQISVIASDKPPKTD